MGKVSFFKVENRTSYFALKDLLALVVRAIVCFSSGFTNKGYATVYSGITGLFLHFSEQLKQNLIMTKNCFGSVCYCSACLAGKKV